MNADKMTAAEYRKIAATQKNKYGAKKTTLDGITFDSKAEAEYYARLKVREAAGEISDVQLQPPFVLSVNSVVVGTYKADFHFWDVTEKRFRVIDVKGFDTPLSRFKRRFVKAQYGIDVETPK